MITPKYYDDEPYRITQVAVTLSSIVKAAQKELHMNNLQCLVASNGACAYRQDIGDQTLKCVVGAALPDNFARECDKQNDSTFSQLVIGGLIKVDGPEEHVHYISQLQAVHDDIKGSKLSESERGVAIKYVLLTVAKLFNLQ